MKYESACTPRGNIGASYSSQVAADEQAKAMDESGCTGCSGCSGCSDCSYCSNCSGCSDCTGCMDCTDCADCTDCTGVLRWEGAKAQALLALNGLRWPVTISEKEMQIGCEVHAHDEWVKFKDVRIALMDPDASAFWAEHRDLLLSLCVRKAKAEQVKP